MRRFTKKPEGCVIIPLKECHYEMKGDTCIGFGRSWDDDEPCECCKNCRYCEGRYEVVE